MYSNVKGFKIETAGLYVSVDNSWAAAMLLLISQYWVTNDSMRRRMNCSKHVKNSLIKYENKNAINRNF